MALDISLDFPKPEVITPPTTESVIHSLKNTSDLFPKVDKQFGKGAAETLVYDVYSMLPHSTIPDSCFDVLPLDLDAYLNPENIGSTGIGINSALLPNQFNRLNPNQLKSALMHAQRIEQMMNFPPDTLYAFAYYARRTLSRQIFEDLRRAGLSNLNIVDAREKIESMPNHQIIDHIRALDRVKDLLGKIAPNLTKKPHLIMSRVDQLMQ